jgi:undecaprenyl-diphosphatase
MNIVQSIILGCLQGLTEFLPVSSSGHLALGRALFGLSEVPVLYDILMHAATLVVVLAFFHRRVLDILRALYLWVSGRAGQEERRLVRLAGLIVLATLVTALVGIPLNRLALDNRPRIISGLFLLSAAVLLVGSRFKGSRRLEDTRLRDVLMVGLAQGIGALPGVSRSGITISAALAGGTARADAGEFSFLLSMPAILGALVLKLKDVGSLSQIVHPSVLLAGLAAAMATGFISLFFLLRVIRSGRLWLFAAYLIPLGIAGLLVF